MAEVGGGGRAELDRVARLLMDAWERAEGTPVGMSYVATFVDLARAVIADRARLQRAVEGAAGALVLVRDRLEAMGGVWVEEDRAWSGVRWRRMPSGR
jgi:hypothetical protein